MKGFREIEVPEDYDLKKACRLVEHLTDYTFKEPKILLIALTHKTKAKKKGNNVWDDYNILEFLGDSIIKFFNCKRIIKKKDKLLKDKEKGFSDIQRLKFIKTNAEKNHLFAFMCIDKGIHAFIRHSTNNGALIQKYVDFVHEKKDDLMIEDTVPYFLKMLADVIESIIGAIMVDSCSLHKTEEAWKVLFEPYLK